jgi:hypothetical protein
MWLLNMIEEKDNEARQLVCAADHAVFPDDQDEDKELNLLLIHAIVRRWETDDRKVLKKVLKFKRRKK